MNMECNILNGICCLLYRRAYKNFMMSCNVNQVQMNYLSRLLQKNAETVYGKKYGFSHIHSYKDFARNVPLTVYEDYEPYIDAIANGEQRVLTVEAVKLFELTSGSSGGKKWIPYTASLKKEFQQGIKPWLYNIYTEVEGIKNGRSYWSITPVTAGRSYTPAGIPIGFEEDAQYFGLLEQSIMKKLFAVDGSVKFAGDMQDFYRKTAIQLLACRELSLISVWNPTFLTILCDFICDQAEGLTACLSKARAFEVSEAVSQNRFDRVFPELKLISCWADGSAADYVEEVRLRFPNVCIQPKGLLATEGFISFPVIGETGSRLSIYSHFYEFRRLSDGEILTTDQLSPGEYEVILTTGGGFYRYCIGDIVRVLDAEPDRPPRIRFLCRSGVSSDFFGEKLTEEFVRGVCEKLGIAEQFCLLAFETDCYCLYTTAADVTPEMVDQALCESYHFHYCRQLGQLKETTVVTVSGNPEKAYLERLANDGIRLGDIKPAYLTRKGGWRAWFHVE